MKCESETVVAHTLHPSPAEADTGGSPAWPTDFQQPELHRNPGSEKPETATTKVEG